MSSTFSAEVISCVPSSKPQQFVVAKARKFKSKMVDLFNEEILSILNRKIFEEEFLKNKKPK